MQHNYIKRINAEQMLDDLKNYMINKSDVENFRQRILEAGDKRLYAIVTLLSYEGEDEE